MNFQALNPIAIYVAGMLVLLASCAQAPNFAPVQTVNQRLPPNNGNIPDTQSITSINKTNHIEQKIFIDKNQQEIIHTQQKPHISERDPFSKQIYQPKTLSDHQADKQTTNHLATISHPKERVSLQKKTELSKPEYLNNKNNISTNSTTNMPIQQSGHIGKKPTPKNPKLIKITIKKSSISIDNKKVLKLNFRWPLVGKISRNYSQTDHKGILISGKKGQSVFAAESGKAVYCGQALVGFGKLAIIKHNEIYLSAYANNSKLSIKEGELVEKGQTIGQIGLTGLRKSSLHFEIRKNGKPINPLTVLPKL